MNEQVMLLYPPGPLYQRGEDRCQGNIEASAATAMRACNDLGYAAAVLLQKNYEVYLKDYQTERLTLADVCADIVRLQPQLILLSVTNGTIFDDLKFVAALKEHTDAVIVLKGAIFWDPPHEMVQLLDLSQVDYIIGGEVEFSIGQVADLALRGEGTAEEIPNIFYQTDGAMHPTFFHVWEQHLDTIPFPARQLMNNALYTRPDTGEAMATIQTSRGCAAGCIYCLSPDISGKHIRYRSVDNVMAELEECYHVHHIRNFFFKADTFTMDAAWVKELCERIIASPLYGNIAFTANSRVRPLKKETLEIMKKAGCFLVAFGFESGSDETLTKAHKGTTVAENRQAARWCKEVGLPVYGFFMIGFPWEGRAHLEATKQLIFELGCDFIEVHIALPYYGTRLYELYEAAGLLKRQTYGANYFESNIQGTSELDYAELSAFRDDVMKHYYLRPSYIAARLKDCLTKPVVLKNYWKYGWRLVGNLMRHPG